MLTRRLALLLAPSAVLAVGLGGAALYLRAGAQTPVGIGGPFSLVDGDGRTVTDRDFRGKWTMVYFGYTRCPDACPTALQDMANAVDQLPPVARRQVAIVFITVDPERDTPAAMKDYVAAFDAPITALSGTPAQVADAMKAYRVYAARRPTKDGYDMDHTSIIYLMDPNGLFVANFTHETPPAKIADKLKTLV